MDHKYILTVLFDCLRVSQQLNPEKPMEYLSTFPARIDDQTELEAWLAMATENQTASPVYAVIELAKCQELIETGCYQVMSKNKCLIPNLTALVIDNPTLQLLIACNEKIIENTNNYSIKTYATFIESELINQQFDVHIPSLIN